MHPEKRLLRTWRAGTAKLKGYLEDYSMLIDGLLAVYAATFEPRFLKSAIELTDEMFEFFWDDDIQRFFDTGSDHEALITRPREIYDNATPSGTAVAIDVLLRLAALTGNEAYERRGVAGLNNLAAVMEQAPTAAGRALCALDFDMARRIELAIVWPNDVAEAKPLLDIVRRPYNPNLVLAGAKAGEADDLSPLLQDRPAIDGKVTAYVCEHFTCQAPTTDPAELDRQLQELSSPPSGATQ
jgi:uncharacterized protein YyaL (SSP411 family)